MKIDIARTPVGIAYIAAVVALGIASSGLAAALWMRASALPSVVLMSPSDAPHVVEPGRVPDALARDFARDYLVAFETYSPATIEGGSAFVKTRIAPSALDQFSRVLENRKKLVAESGMVSQVLIEDPAKLQVSREDRRLDVILKGIRRVYVADKLAQEARLVYRIALEAGEPTRENPTGLLVTGQSVKLEEKERGKTAPRP